MIMLTFARQIIQSHYTIIIYELMKPYGNLPKIETPPLAISLERMHLRLVMTYRSAVNFKKGVRIDNNFQKH